MEVMEYPARAHQLIPWKYAGRYRDNGKHMYYAFRPQCYARPRGVQTIMFATTQHGKRDTLIGRDRLENIEWDENLQQGWALFLRLDQRKMIWGVAGVGRAVRHSHLLQHWVRHCREHYHELGAIWPNARPDEWLNGSEDVSDLEGKIGIDDMDLDEKPSHIDDSDWSSDCDDDMLNIKPEARSDDSVGIKSESPRSGIAAKMTKKGGRKVTNKGKGKGRKMIQRRRASQRARTPKGKRTIVFRRKSRTANRVKSKKHDGIRFSSSEAERKHSFSPPSNSVQVANDAGSIVGPAHKHGVKKESEDIPTTRSQNENAAVEPATADEELFFSDPGANMTQPWSNFEERARCQSLSDVIVLD